VQRLFATGLSLQGAAALIRSDPGSAVRRVNAAVDDLDLTVKHIRSAIFGLESVPDRGVDGVRRRVLDVVAEAAGMLGFEPTVLFEGQVDAATPEPVAADLLATLREALSNVARHAQAGKVDVVVTVQVGDAGALVLRVTDNGVGPPSADQPRGHGLDNMAARAHRRGGSFEIGPATPHGTELTWRVALGSAGSPER
jgi:signal transduction histidine kinase